MSDDIIYDNLNILEDSYLGIKHSGGSVLIDPPDKIFYFVHNKHWEHYYGDTE
jgi:hypothetical protein